MNLMSAGNCLMVESLESIRSSHRGVDPASTLEKPTSILLGVSQAAAKALSDVGVITVFDLASSEIFSLAVDVCLLAESGAGRFAAIGKLPHDALREGHDKPLRELPLQPISILSTHAQTTQLDTLAAALDISSIRDLAAWPPYRTAREMLNRSYNPLALNGLLDHEAPADLIPATGQYPTERVQYEVLLFDEFIGRREASPPPGTYVPDNTGQSDASAPRPLGADGPFDISRVLANYEGYQRPAIGGILTFTQSWYTKALSLGNLIHSIALAPGESTKIAVIDWARTVRTSATEDIQEGEKLESDLSRSRAISEITSSVARETQTGQSAASNYSTATQHGSGTGAAQFRDPIFQGPISLTSPGVETSGTSFGSATGHTTATTWSTTSGERDVAAELSQDIDDRTHQAAHSARNRRASIVREVSQQESESISTRTLTNYNHMHALTIEYYEVVQLYRTVVELSKADRCLFVPMKLIDFRNNALVDRFRPVLAAASLTPAVRDALVYRTGTTRIKASTISRAPQGRTLTEQPDGTFAEQPEDPHENWNTAEIVAARLATGGMADVLPDGRLVLPSDTVLYGVDFFDMDEAMTPLDLIIGYVDGSSSKLTYGESGWVMDNNRSRIDEIATLAMTASGGPGPLKIVGDGFGSVIMNLRFQKKDFTIYIPVKLKENSIVPIVFAGAMLPADVISHLQDHRVYYSQAVWRALDSTTIGMMLSRYTWQVGGKTKSLAELVDPTPVAMVANYLVFRMSGDDEKERIEWLDKKKILIGNRREDLVPVPSGGVFAEAVLGRFNSAEKLDITRFWNWQDSPIPIQAPDIAAIQAGSRSEPDNTTPGQLGTPVLNIVNPPALPDPQGMSAVLAAIQNGNMFRDMSGLAATIGLAQAGLAGAQQAASDASTQAGQNAAVAAELGAKMAEIVAKIIAAYFSGGSSSAAGAGGGALAGLAGGISGQGAKINHGKDMDQRNAAPQNSGSVGGAGTGSAPSASSGAGNGARSFETNGSEVNSAPAGGNEGAAFRTALGSGAGGIPGQLLSSISGQIPVVSGTKAWPKLDKERVLARLNALKENADLFDQGGLGLCTAASFYHHIIQKDPLQFYTFASALYGQGIAYLGKLKIAPGSDLRSSDYKAIHDKYPVLPPEADWMLMSALRDSENWFFDFEGAPDETVAMETTAKEMSGWYEGTGFYSSVDYSSGEGLAHIKKIKKTASNHVALWIGVKLLKKELDGTHMITLESPIMIDEAKNTVRFDYWTWAQPVKTITTTVDAMKTHYHGVITATY